MIVSKYSKDERLALVMECRKSGLTDALWCQQHDIPVGTFYNWVKRFRHQGISVPAANGKTVTPVKQEVVKVDIIDTDAYELNPQAIRSTNHSDDKFIVEDNNHKSSDPSIIEVSVFGADIKFSDTINPAILSRTLRLIKELSC